MVPATLRLPQNPRPLFRGGRYGIAANGHDGGDAHINEFSHGDSMEQSAGIFAQTNGASVITTVNSSHRLQLKVRGIHRAQQYQSLDDPTAVSVVINNAGNHRSKVKIPRPALAILEVGGMV